MRLRIMGMIDKTVELDDAAYDRLVHYGLLEEWVQDYLEKEGGLEITYGPEEEFDVRN